eukprot:gene5276-6114_t
MESNPLTLDQESYLKQQLLKYSVQEEIKVYFGDSNFLEETLFLKFLFHQLTTIPLLTSKAQAKIKFQQLIHTLPMIVIQSQIASKQETKDHFRKFVVKIFDVALRTPQEKKNDKTLKVFADPSLEEESLRTQRKKKNQETLEEKEEAVEEEEKPRTAKDIERDETIVKLQKRLTELTQIIINDVEKQNTTTADGTGSQQNGISNLFNIILRTKHFKDLPAEFYEFTQTVIKIIALWMERELRDPKQIIKLKRLYMITPVKAIRASLAIANPITLLKGFIILFLAKPFGARNLIQTIASVMVEIGKTDRALKKAQKDLENILNMAISNRSTRKLLQQKMKSFVANINNVSDATGQPIAYFKDVPEAIEILTYQWPSSPSVDPGIIAQLDEVVFEALFEYVKLEKRKKEKNDFIDILGNDEMIDIIRELLPVLYEPLGKLFCKANIGYHFEKLAHVFKRIINVAETGELEEDDESDLDLSGVDISDLDVQTPPANFGSDVDLAHSTPTSTHSSPTQQSEQARSYDNNNNNNNGSSKNIFQKSFGWLKPSNLFGSSQSRSQPSTPPAIYSPDNTDDLKRRLKKDKNSTITMAERLSLFEEVSYQLMERIYDMVHDLVTSDAKLNTANGAPDAQDNTTGLLSQSVCWLLGLLQFLKDEEIDVYTEIFRPLSPDFKAKIIVELDQVIAYREWREEHGNLEATKANIDIVDNQNIDLTEEVVEHGPDKPDPQYLPMLTGPFIELVKQRFARLQDPTKYSMTNLSKVIVNEPDNIPAPCRILLTGYQASR